MLDVVYPLVPELSSSRNNASRRGLIFQRRSPLNPTKGAAWLYPIIFRTVCEAPASFQAGRTGGGQKVKSSGRMNTHTAFFPSAPSAAARSPERTAQNSCPPFSSLTMTRASSPLLRISTIRAQKQFSSSARSGSSCSGYGDRRKGRCSIAGLGELCECRMKRIGSGVVSFAATAHVLT